MSADLVPSLQTPPADWEGVDRQGCVPRHLPAPLLTAELCSRSAANAVQLQFPNWPEVSPLHGEMGERGNHAMGEVPIQRNWFNETEKAVQFLLRQY